MRGTKFPTDPDNIEEGCCDICKFHSFTVASWNKEGTQEEMDVCETCIEEFEQAEEIKLEFFGTLSPEQFTKLKQFTPMEINTDAK